MNVMINSYCNLQCPYCFAEESMSNSCSGMMNMDNDSLDKVIEFHKKNDIREMRIIGGEPTLHPDFKYILSRLAHDNFFKRIHIFSNLTFDKEILETMILLSKFTRITLLPNINEPHLVGEKKWANILHNLKYLTKYKLIDILGVNIYRPDMDMSFIFDLAKQFDIKELRWSITIPNQTLDENFNVKGYFRSFSEVLKEFLTRCIEEQITPNMDCNSLPLCAFDDDVYRLITYASNEINGKNHCSIVVDIKPNLEVVRCFGLSDCHTEQLTDYMDSSVKKLRKSLDEATATLRDGLLFEECKDCLIYKKNGKRCCSCLAYRQN